MQVDVRVPLGGQNGSRMAGQFLGSGKRHSVPGKAGDICVTQRVEVCEMATGIFVGDLLRDQVFDNTAISPPFGPLRVSPRIKGHPRQGIPILIATAFYRDGAAVEPKLDFVSGHKGDGTVVALNGKAEKGCNLTNVPLNAGFVSFL